MWNNCSGQFLTRGSWQQWAPPHMAKITPSHQNFTKHVPGAMVGANHHIHGYPDHTPWGSTPVSYRQEKHQWSTFLSYCNTFPTIKTSVSCPFKFLYFTWIIDLTLLARGMGGGGVLQIIILILHHITYFCLKMRKIDNGSKSLIQ